MSWRVACLYLKPFLYKLLQWMRGDLYLELWLVWVYEWGWVGSVLGESARLQWIQWAFQICRVLVSKPSPKGGDGGIHLLGMGLLLDRGSFSCEWGWLVCLDESVVTPVLLLPGRCRNPFHRIRMYSCHTHLQITCGLGFEDCIYFTISGQQLYKEVPYF